MSAADKLALRYVLWHFEDYARGKGTPAFIDALLTAIEEANDADLEKLRLVYPELVDFVTLAKQPGGLGQIREAVAL